MAPGEMQIPPTHWVSNLFFSPQSGNKCPDAADPGIYADPPDEISAQGSAPRA